MKNKILEFLRKIKFLRLIFLRIFIYFNNLSYSMIKIFAVAPGGLHPKHAIMNYHKFFVDNIGAADKILDIGCGNGAVAHDVAAKAQRVIGIDISENNIKKARKKFSRPNLEYLTGDCLGFDFSGLGIEKFDAIIMSNVLEHLDGRIEFLKKLPRLSDKILLRVPLITRDWLAVYKKECGYKYKLSADHKIEYTEDGLKKELRESGWQMEKYSIKFGEIWAIIKKI